MPAPISVWGAEKSARRPCFTRTGRSPTLCSLDARVGVPVIGVLVAIALAGSPVEGAAPPKPVAGGSIASLFSADDYPPGSANRGEQGNVQVVIHVDDKGAVSSCEIKTSSGYPELDTQTCNIIALRARFEPARNSNGEPVAGEIIKTVDWRLADSAMPNTAWSMRMTFLMDKDGKATSCLIQGQGMHLPPASPTPCPAGALNHPPSEWFPDLPANVTRFTLETAFAPGDEATPATLAPGDSVIDRSVASLTISADGRVESCQPVTSAGAGHNADLCRAPQGQRIEPRKDPDGKPVSFEATLAVTASVRVGGGAPHR